MGDEKAGGSLKEAGEGLRSILERIADFFDIFDLSFIVSGATTISAFTFWAWRAGLPLPGIPSGWIPAVGLVIACYVAGLICFALGRWIRMGWRARSAETGFHDWFATVLRGHGIDTTPSVEAYLARKDSRGAWRLYVRLWAEVRQSSRSATSLSLLRRYWVMAATYDGVAVSLVVWALVCADCAFGFGGVKLIDKWLALPLAGALIVCARACSREAGRYVEYQVEDLVASIAASRQT